MRIQLSHDSFTYTLKDRSGSRTFTARYLDLDPGSRYELQERNEYFRNVGFLWLIIALFDLVVGSGISALLWGGLAILCLGIYYFASTKYFVIPSSQGAVFIIDDARAPAIIEELLAQYKREVMEEYGEVDHSHTFEEEKRKYRMLLRQGVIDEPRFNEILRAMEAERERFARPSA